MFSTPLPTLTALRQGTLADEAVATVLVVSVVLLVVVVLVLIGDIPARATGGMT